MNYSSLLVALAACIISLGSFVDAQSPPSKVKYNLKFGKKFSTPYPELDSCTWKTYTGLGCSRHHIIPRSVLQKFYNKLVDEKKLYQLREFFKAYKTNFEEFYNSLNPAAHRITIQNVKKLVDEILGQKIEHDAKANPPTNFDEFGAYFTWLPKDLFIGLTNRSDDPGDNFELKSVNIIGSDDYKIINDTNNDIKKYLEGKKISIYIIDGNLKKIFDKPAGGVLLPYEYREADWIRNNKGAKEGSYYIVVKKQFSEYCGEDIITESPDIDEISVQESTTPS